MVSRSWICLCSHPEVRVSLLLPSSIESSGSHWTFADTSCWEGHGCLVPASPFPNLTPWGRPITFEWWWASWLWNHLSREESECLALVGRRWKSRVSVSSGTLLRLTLNITSTHNTCWGWIFWLLYYQIKSYGSCSGRAQWRLSASAGEGSFLSRQIMKPTLRSTQHKLWLVGQGMEKLELTSQINFLPTWWEGFNCKE